MTLPRSLNSPRGHDDGPGPRPRGGKIRPVPDYVTPSEEVLKADAKTQPSKGGKIPKDLVSRLGAAHVAGKYCFTDKPFLLEGCDDLLRNGFSWSEAVVHQHSGSVSVPFGVEFAKGLYTGGAGAASVL